MSDLSEKQRGFIFYLGNKMGLDLDGIKERYGIASISKLSDDEAEDLIERMKVDADWTEKSLDETPPASTPYEPYPPHVKFSISNGNFKDGATSWKGDVTKAFLDSLIVNSSDLGDIGNFRNSGDDWELKPLRERIERWIIDNGYEDTAPWDGETRHWSISVPSNFKSMHLRPLYSVGNNAYGTLYVNSEAAAKDLIETFGIELVKEHVFKGDAKQVQLNIARAICRYEADGKHHIALLYADELIKLLYTEFGAEEAAEAYRELRIPPLKFNPTGGQHE